MLFSCGSEALVAPEVGVRKSSLELDCATVPADATGDVISILPSIEPLDPSSPQTYGSERCAGVVFEFDNPDGEALRGAWIQAGGESSSSADVLSESRCPTRVLEADYWGSEGETWSRLASTASFGSFDLGLPESAGYCRLEGLIERAGAFEKLRVIARVSQGSQTYPMHASVW